MNLPDKLSNLSVVHHSLSHPADFTFAQKCLDREPEVLRSFSKKYEGRVIGHLTARGAKQEEARDVVTQLWSDCVVGNGDRPAKLNNFNGQCSLQTWLNTVALNDWLTKARRKTLWVKKAEKIQKDPTVIPEPSAGADPEEVLIKLMCDGIKAGFAVCSAQDFVLLYLIAVYQLKPEEVGKMFRCSETSIRRMLVLMRKKFKNATMDRIHETDPHLELTWADFIKLCGIVGPGFFGLDLD